MEDRDPRQSGESLLGDAPGDPDMLAVISLEGVRRQLEAATRLSPLERLLQERKEAGELEPQDFGFDDVRRVYEEGRAITRRDIENRALRLSREEVDQFGIISYIDTQGEEQMMEAECLRESIFILFPEDFGNPEDRFRVVGDDEEEVKTF